MPKPIIKGSNPYPKKISVERTRGIQTNNQEY